jgi:ribosomal protein L37AE/L43A
MGGDAGGDVMDENYAKIVLPSAQYMHAAVNHECPDCFKPLERRDALCGDDIVQSVWVCDPCGILMVPGMEPDDEDDGTIAVGDLPALEKLDVDAEMYARCMTDHTCPHCTNSMEHQRRKKGDALESVWACRKCGIFLVPDLDTSAGEFVPGACPGCSAPMSSQIVKIADGIELGIWICRPCDVAVIPGTA